MKVLNVFLCFLRFLARCFPRPVLIFLISQEVHGGRFFTNEFVHSPSSVPSNVFTTHVCHECLSSRFTPPMLPLAPIDQSPKRRLIAKPVPHPSHGDWSRRRQLQPFPRKIFSIYNLPPGDAFLPSKSPPDAPSTPPSSLLQRPLAVLVLLVLPPLPLFYFGVPL